MIQVRFVVWKDRFLVLADCLTLLSADDPLSHVLDTRWGGFFTWHMLMVLISGVSCVLIFPRVAAGIAADGTGGRVGGFFESILVYLRDQVTRPFLGEEGDRYLPIVWTFFFFILFCNLLGMIPVVGRTATANINVTAALALVSFVLYHSIGIKKHGFVHYLMNNLLVGPWYLWPLMVPIEIMGHLIRPCALAIRLFANMVAGHTMLAVILGFTVVLTKSALVLGSTITAVSVSAAVALSFLELLVAFIQAFIFTFLTTVFLSLAVQSEH
ncbi:MAG: F0F1 ATP synthase subunit A [Planctomycetota bacterium]